MVYIAGMAGATRICCQRESISAQVLCTPYKHAPCHFMQSHIRKVYACLAVTCHLRFWQNDRPRGLLRATAVTRGWNEYQNKSQHRKSTLEKKILPPLLNPFTAPACKIYGLGSAHIRLKMEHFSVLYQTYFQYCGF